MESFVHNFVQDGLWIILEGLARSDKNINDILLKRKLRDDLGEEGETCFDLSKTSSIISFDYQLQWLTSRVLNCSVASLYSTDATRRAKQAQYEYFLQELGETTDSNVAKELYYLSERVSRVAPHSVPCPFPMSVESSEFLHDSLLRNPFAGLSLIHSLLSPCIPSLAESDAALTALCIKALETAVHKLEEQHEYSTMDDEDQKKGITIFMQLLSALLDSDDLLPRIKNLVDRNILNESEIHLALVARKGNPPQLLQSFCELSSPESTALLDSHGRLCPQVAFQLQTATGEHWLLHLLELCYQQVINKDLNVTKQLFSKSPMLLLAPLLMLRAWDQQVCDQETINHLNALCKESIREPLFHRLGFLLDRRAIVLKWVKNLDKKGSSTLESKIINKLERYSALRVLHESGCLIHSDWTEVQKLLDKATLASNDENWESTLFQGFCIMTSALNIIWSSANKSGTSQNNQRENTNEDSSEQDLSMNTEATRMLQLNHIQGQLQHLYPLLFRLEILENLFSLLFLRYEDLRVDEGTSDSGGEDEDESWKQSRIILEESREHQEPSSSTSQPLSLSTLDNKITSGPVPLVTDTVAGPFNRETNKTDIKINRGFVCTPIMIKYFLDCLKECIVDCTAAFYKQSGIVNINADTPESNLQRRINILSQYVTEAWWRLQLVTGLPGMPKFELFTPGTTVIPEQQRGYPSSASSSDSETAPEERRRLERVQRRMSHSSRQSRSDHTDRSSESSSNTTGSAASSSGVRFGRRRTRAQHRLPHESDSVVRLLLSSPSTLALMCLAGRDFSKAQQVIQTFQLTKSSLATEANFLEIYETVAKEISYLNKPCSPRDYVISPINLNSPLTGKLIVSSKLEVVRKAASAGLSAVNITSQVERILSLAPEIHGLDKIITDHRTAAYLLSDLTSDVMAACDLALTLGNSRDTSLSLMDIVSQRWRSTSTTQDTRVVAHNQSITTFISRIMELFRFLSKISKEDSEHGLVGVLTSWELPLSMSLMKDYSTLWSTLQDSLSLFLNETSSTNSKAQVVALRKVIKICGSSNSFIESRGLTNSGLEPLSYLQQLLWYLQTLSSLITKSTDVTDGQYSPFEILSDGWSELLGRLVFDLEAPLGHVERVAARLQLDLMYAIVATCCPSLQLSHPACTLNNNPRLPAASAWGKISLNASSNSSQLSSGDVPAAGTLANSLLLRLIAALQICCKSPILNTNDFNAASTNEDVLQILNDTTELSNVDLETLTQDLDKVAFLCNVINLLFLHGLVVLTAEWGLASQSWSEKISAFNCVGYHIGQMGFMPLSSLLNLLLKRNVDQMLSIHHCNEQYWQVEDKRALFVLSQGTIHSPIIQVLDGSQASAQLDSAVTSYIARGIRVEGSVSEGCFALVISPLILEYLGLSSPSYLDQAEEARDEPAPPQLKHFKLVSHLARDCATNLPSLLAFLQSYASGTLQQQLAEWADAWNCSSEDNTDMIVTVEEPSSRFGVILPSSLEILNSESMQSSFMTAEEASLINADWESRKLSQSVTKYLESHCWLVGTIATRLRQECSDIKHLTKTACLDRLLIDIMPALTPIGSGNVMLASLQPWPLQAQHLWPVLDKLLAEQKEADCVRLLLALPEASLSEDTKLQTFRDLLLYYMASQPQTQGISTPWRLALSLGTSELRAQCVLGAIQFWPGTESIDTLKTILGEPTLKQSTRDLISNTLHKVGIYQQVHQVLCYFQKNKISTLEGWYDVCKLSETDPGQVLQALIDSKQYRLCLPWAELHGIPHRAQHLVDVSFLALLLETETSDISQAEKLLQSVPIPQAIFICRRLLGCLTSLTSLQFVVRFALESCTSWLKENPVVWARLQLWRVGLSILAILPEPEQVREKPLASQPHLLLEQLLMNTRLSTLNTALNILRTADLSALPAESSSHPSAMDAMLRQYASKALDLRVSRRTVPEVAPPPVELDDLLQSLSTGSTTSGPVPFIMPASAPTKEQWVPNEEVTECMCCVAESFSMFNRRHHCRRCGRVVCGSCSNNRTKVEGYGDLPVRVCIDCNLQMKQQSVNDYKQQLPSDPSSSSSQQAAGIEWRLLGEEPHDNTVREEFGFEHAPSVALCLSILGLHSEHAAAQPRFLLEAADRMLQLLVPPTPGYVNPELDYGLVIRMARSLVVAAKVRYARSSLNSGVAHCDKLLGQVDLLALLVRSGCAAMLPVEPLPLSGHALRHLRDRLVASELWPLALEVSTKAGLERGGVWAAWGKACLRAGRWGEAREHLAHCLQAPMCAQDPSPAPLLTEVIRILEETSYTPDPAVIKQAEHIPAPALSVLHSLAALKDISQGKFPSGPATSTQHLFYSESQYYLRNYGSPAATLSFFLSHADLTRALTYSRERNIESEVFAEALYKPCLRQGFIDKLHQEMKIMDASLEIWKPTLLHVGRVLERHGMLHSLYQLQLYTQDLVRAAMTCIRFYCAGARCYTDLAPEHLQKARTHLEQELAASWTSDTKRRDSESPSSNPSSDSTEAVSPQNEIQLPLKLPARQLDHHICTICRQLEAAKFLQHCESEGRSVIGVAAELSKTLEPAAMSSIPTLFGNSTERTYLSALVILCGRNVEEGFGITFRIIQDFRLRASRIYGIAAQWLTNKGELGHIEQLVSCIRSSGSADSAACSDELLLQCVHQLVKQGGTPLQQVDSLLRIIMDPASKIQAHIACGQLKSAYLLAVKLSRVADVRAVLSEAERLNQPIMRRICSQWLTQQDKQVK